MYHIFTCYAYILKKSKSCKNVCNNYGGTRILIYITFMWVLIALICVPVIRSQFTSLRFCKKLGSSIIPLATSQSTSVYPIINATHSHTTMTDSGTMSNDLKKRRLHLISVPFFAEIYQLLITNIRRAKFSLQNPLQRLNWYS